MEFYLEILGHHALLDVYGCDADVLNDLGALKRIFLDTANALKCTIVDEVFHRFAPQGVSGVVVIAESHLSIHTWPERRYAAIDLYTCGDPTQVDRMPKILQQALGAERYEFKRVPRGFVPRQNGMGFSTQNAFGDDVEVA